MRKFIQRFKETRLTPGAMGASSMTGEQGLAMHITRGATGIVEHRTTYYHPKFIKRYWVRLLLTLGIKDGKQYCGFCNSKEV